MECLKFFLSSLTVITRTLFALKEDGKNAVETFLKFLLYAVDALAVDERKKELQHAVPFIIDWVSANVSEKFSSASQKNIEQEYQVYCNLI